jgi:hypothetical protein
MSFTPRSILYISKSWAISGRALPLNRGHANDANPRSTGGGSMKIVGFGAVALLFILVLMPVVWALLKGRLLAAIAAFIIMIVSMTFGPLGYMLGFIISLIVVGMSVSNHNQKSLITAFSTATGKNSRVDLRDHPVTGMPGLSRRPMIDISEGAPASSGKVRLEPQLQPSFIEYWACPTCRGAIVEFSRYCSHCGTEVAWPKA